MAKRVHPDQIAFSFPEPSHPWVKPVEPTPAVEATLTLAERHWAFLGRLVDAGLAANVDELEGNRYLTVPPEHRRGETWGLPSRLFRYGIRLMNRWDHLGPRLAVHAIPMLCHPYIDVVRALGFEVGLDPTIELPGWHHAVDLMTNRHFKDLLRTRHHTDPMHVAGAVMDALMSDELQVRNARTVMAEMGWPEPKGRSLELLRGQGLQPRRVVGGIAPNPMSCGPDGAWMMIHALEDKWLKMDHALGPHAWMTPEGMARRAA